MTTPERMAKLLTDWIGVIEQHDELRQSIPLTGLRADLRTAAAILRGVRQEGGSAAPDPLSGEMQNIERLAALLEAADMMLPRGEPRPRKRIAEYLIARGATPGV